VKRRTRGRVTCTRRHGSSTGERPSDNERRPLLGFGGELLYHLTSPGRPLIPPLAKKEIILKTIARHTLLFVILIGGVIVCPAQTGRPEPVPAPRPEAESDPASWKEYSSAEGRFSITFPGTPKVEVTTMNVPGGTFEIHIHNLKASSEYGVIYADYQIPVGDSNVAKQLLDNGAKGAAATVNAELLSMTDITIDGSPGRLLRERLPDGRILKAKMYLVGRRLYQIAVTMPQAENAPDGGKADEEFADKFLDSFKLIAEQTAGIKGEPALTSDRPSGRDVEPERAARINGGILNGKAVRLPQPRYPAEAKAAGASGEVTVKIVIDESGDVISAEALSGHELLRAAAEEASSRAKFRPTKLQGKPVKITGVLVYKFVRKN
jgi:TonB family protein